MSAVVPEAGELFTLRIVKQLLADSTKKWVNTYEIRAEADDPTGENRDTTVNALVDFEQDLLYDNAKIVQAIFSTYVENQYYDPLNFVSYSYNFTGGRPVSSNSPVDLRICLGLSKEVVGGRRGKLALRNNLVEQEIAANAGVSVLSSPSTIQGLVDTAKSPLEVLHILKGGGTYTWVMVGENANNVQHVRVVTDVLATGVSHVDLNHRWFNSGS